MNNSEIIRKTGLQSFVGYLVAGFPSREESIRVFKDCCEAGLDVLELGFPAKNPHLDGDVIRRTQRQIDYALAQDIDYWREVRKNVMVPVWLMGYRDDLEDNDIYLKLAQEHLYDALVLPDAEFSERMKLQKRLKPYEVDVVGFINGTMSQKEIDRVLLHSGLIYHQLYCGPTGICHNDDSYLPLYRYAREHSNARIFAGFGINNPERAEELLLHGYDGVIIGSVIVKHLLEREEDACRFIESIHEVCRQVREKNGA